MSSADIKAMHRPRTPSLSMYRSTSEPLPRDAVTLDIVEQGGKYDYSSSR